jgi:hypothetical protein
MSAKFIEFLSQFEAADPALIESIRHGYAATLVESLTTRIPGHLRKDPQIMMAVKNVEKPIERLMDAVGLVDFENYGKKIEAISTALGDGISSRSLTTGELASMKAKIDAIKNAAVLDRRLTPPMKETVKEWAFGFTRGVNSLSAIPALVQ